MNFKWLISSGLILMLTSCSHVYTPALYRRDIIYQPKPSSFDSVKTATYISAALNLAPFVNHNDQQESAQINVSRGYAFNHVNLAYGAFGVLGDYENGAIAAGAVNYFTYKYYGALGAVFLPICFQLPPPSELNTGISDLRRRTVMNLEYTATSANILMISQGTSSTREPACLQLA